VSLVILMVGVVVMIGVCNVDFVLGLSCDIVLCC